MFVFLKYSQMEEVKGKVMPNYKRQCGSKTGRKSQNYKCICDKYAALENIFFPSPIFFSLVLRVMQHLLLVLIGRDYRHILTLLLVQPAPGVRTGTF